MKTQGEYDLETKIMIMGDEKPPRFGYKPIDIRTRVEDLIEREKRAKEICETKSFKKAGIKCPYCGWTHG